MILVGAPSETAERASALTASLPDADVLWIAAQAPARACAWSSPRRLVRRLGQAFDAVVVDAHAELDADVLGQAHGLVWGGGALVLRRDEDGPTASARARVAALPYGPDDVVPRFERRALSILRAGAERQHATLSPVAHTRRGSAEQSQVVHALQDIWAKSGVAHAVLTAGRGRGKSSALGLALRGARGSVVVTAARSEAVAEVLRFAPPDVAFVPIVELLRPGITGIQPPAVVVVDEAAMIPVPVLRAVVQRYPTTRFVFASTTHGYEGTGRGFSLRFVQWLEARPDPVHALSLDTPIRWSAGDPLERLIFDALLLDAEPAAIAPTAGWRERVSVQRLQRDALIGDERRLRQLFGLLVSAHYRTTPGDLRRMLDAPNLQVHAALLDGDVVGATLVAQEGALSSQLCADASAGRTRLQSHALADALVAHLGRTDAGQLRMLRSVRIAVHPAMRRRGIATALVKHVHREGDPDLFGTLFGATPQLVAFRRSLGYEVVRLSASRGAHSGEPSVLMIRPQTEAAQTLVASLRQELSRQLDAQVRLAAADAGIPLQPALLDALRAGLSPAVPYGVDEARRVTQAYTAGPRTFESVAAAVAVFVRAHLDAMGQLAPASRAAIEARVLGAQAWRDVMAAAELSSLPATMRLLRRALAELLAVAPTQDQSDSTV